MNRAQNNSVLQLLNYGPVYLWIVLVAESDLNYTAPILITDALENLGYSDYLFLYDSDK